MERATRALGVRHMGPVEMSLWPQRPACAGRPVYTPATSAGAGEAVLRAACALMPARSWAQVGPGGPRLDLALDMVDGDGALELTLEYNADLFSERSMRQMAGHYLARHPAIPRLHACRLQW